nr:unnamed protein product [Digitaria exilis]
MSEVIVCTRPTPPWRGEAPKGVAAGELASIPEAFAMQHDLPTQNTSQQVAAQTKRWWRLVFRSPLESLEGLGCSDDASGVGIEVVASGWSGVGCKVAGRGIGVGQGSVDRGPTISGTLSGSCKARGREWAAAAQASPRSPALPRKGATEHSAAEESRGVAASASERSNLLVVTEQG